MTRIAFALIGLVAAGTSSVGAQGPVRILKFEELAALAPKVASLRASPKSITLHVGQTVSLDSIKVTVLDSAGRVLGLLQGYDFGIQPNQPATAEPRKMTGVRPGTTELAIRFPRNAWKARTDPRAEVKVRVVVKP
jgi:hypothetical protein